MENESSTCFLQIIPLKMRDSNIIKNNKNDVLQRIKVPKETSLYTIAHYILRLSDSKTQLNSIVELFGEFGGKNVKIPQSLSVIHYFIITNQSEDGAIRYTFTNKEDFYRNSHKFPKTQLIVRNYKENTFDIETLQPIENSEYNSSSNSDDQTDDQETNNEESTSQKYTEPNYPPPSIIGDSIFPPTLNDSTFTLNSINQVHPGLSFFSISFGYQPQTHDNSKHEEAAEKEHDEAISLKKDLEQILRK